MRRVLAEWSSERGILSSTRKKALRVDNHPTVNERLELYDKNLRAEIDSLRLRNQMLRIEIDRSKELSHLLNLTLRAIWSKLYLKIRQLKLKLHDLKTYIAGARYDDTFNEGFKPYQVKTSYSPSSYRPKVMHFIANFATGGSSRLVVDLVENLGHKFEQEIITECLPKPPSYEGIKICEYNYTTSTGRIISRVKKFEPDIIHVHYWGGVNWEWYKQVFQAAEAYGCKVIENVNVPIEPYVSDAVSRYVYVSDYVRHEFGRLDSQNTTIYPGYDLNMFQNRYESRLSDNCIGMVYRLESDKLNEYSIDPFVKAIQRRQGTKALIVGGGHLLKSYRDTVRRAAIDDAFTFTGYVSYEELPLFYERMAIFVAPVHTESFGQVVPFAMNMGMPVTGYNVGALEEILGDGSLLAPPGDSGRLADLIIELLDDRERRMRIGSNNRQRAQLSFSVESMINGYDALYAELLNSSH